MLYDITDISKLEGSTAKVDIVFTPEFDRPGGCPVEKIEEVHLKGVITNNGGIFQFNGRYNLHYIDLCARCLEEFEGELESELAVDFSWPEKSTDAEMYSFTGYRIPLGVAVEDSIILNVPSKNLCSENCKGLCQVCGTNLNYKQCDCQV
jgi:uncharacterized protein